MTRTATMATTDGTRTSMTTDAPLQGCDLTKLPDSLVTPAITTSRAEESVLGRG
jgi:hypothetical protein